MSTRTRLAITAMTGAAALVILAAALVSWWRWEAAAVFVGIALSMIATRVSMEPESDAPRPARVPPADDVTHLTRPRHPAAAPPRQFER